jgi:hypothetical protein
MKFGTALLVLLVALAAVVAPATEKDSVSRAQEATTAWLALVDQGSYGQSWDKASSVFQAAVTKADWETALKSVRSPLGAVKSRKLKSATYTKTLPGAPEGEYVVIQYDTEFAAKAGATETVTPMREKDGAWKVSGYFVK